MRFFSTGASGTSAPFSALAVASFISVSDIVVLFVYGLNIKYYWNDPPIEGQKQDENLAIILSRISPALHESINQSAGTQAQTLMNFIRTSLRNVTQLFPPQFLSL